jgi:succinoglycan biosynthesis protein ExoA
MMVDVSVLTPVLNEEEHIREAAAKMLAQRFDGTIEFVFIDGASEDRTVEILRELQRQDPRVRILENPRRSTPVGLNIGLAAARGTYIARMDAHTLYPEDYLARGVDRLRRGGAAHVSGPQLARGEGTWSRRVALALETPLGRGGAQFRQASADEIEVDSGFTGVWPRAVLESQGGWDEDWHNDQDSELAARIRGAGGRILCLPEMSAQYIPRNSLPALARQYWRYGVYRAKTSGAHPESMRRSHLFAPTLALSLAASILPLGGLRKLGRLAVALWMAVMVGVASAAAWRADTAVELEATGADVAALPAVFGAMHLAWGFGFLWGCLRFGPPVRALRQLARRSSA